MLHQRPCGDIVRFISVFGGERGSWHQLEGLSGPRSDPNGAEIPAIRRQNSVNATSLGHCGHGAINEAKIKPSEFGIQF